MVGRWVCTQNGLFQGCMFIYKNVTCANPRNFVNFDCQGTIPSLVPFNDTWDISNHLSGFAMFRTLSPIYLQAPLIWGCPWGILLLYHLVYHHVTIPIKKQFMPAKHKKWWNKIITWQFFRGILNLLTCSNPCSHSLNHKFFIRKNPMNIPLFIVKSH